MKEREKEEEIRTLQEILEEFCKPIFTKQDHLELCEIETFLAGLAKEERLALWGQYSSHIQEVRGIVQVKIYNYISSYGTNDAGEPFSFDSDNGSGLKEYRKDFTDKYKESFKSDPPEVFVCAFDCIKEASESYRLFENFFSLKRGELEKTTELFINPELNRAKKELREKAEQVAKNTANEIKEDVSKRINNEVQKKMAEVLAKASETSVTILGMFSCIVLTVVAGLFYSSSVIANIGPDNFIELIAAASIVGLVCIDMISIMFIFIEKNRGSTKISADVKTSESPKIPTLVNLLLIGVNVILVLSFIFFCYCHFANTGDTVQQSDSSVSVSEPAPVEGDQST